LARPSRFSGQSLAVSWTEQLVRLCANVFRLPFFSSSLSPCFLCVRAFRVSCSAFWLYFVPVFHFKKKRAIKKDTTIN
jgi:hypothetical protein